MTSHDLCILVDCQIAALSAMVDIRLDSFVENDLDMIFYNLKSSDDTNEELHLPCVCCLHLIGFFLPCVDCSSARVSHQSSSMEFQQQPPRTNKGEAISLEFVQHWFTRMC